MASQRDRPGGSGPRRIERMSAIRQREHEVHLGAKVDEVPCSLPARIPQEAPRFVERNRSKKRDTGWNVSDAESDFGRGGKEILLRIACHRSERVER